MRGRSPLTYATRFESGFVAADKMSERLTKTVNPRIPWLTRVGEFWRNARLSSPKWAFPDRLVAGLRTAKVDQIAP
jgi:hypothetical protein